MLMQVFFWWLALVLVASAIGVITSRNPVFSALFLVLAFVTSAFLWMLLEAEFLAIVLTMRKRPGLKQQDIARQVAVRRDDRVRLVSMEAERES